MWGAFFPGQGSQSVGMGKYLHDHFDIAKLRFQEASDLLSLDFRKLCFASSEAEISLTENAQPALLLVSTVCYEVLQQNTGVQIHAGSGHSLGEYSALVAAGVLSFSDAIKAVRARGLSMQNAVPVGEGGMLAVLGLQDSDVNVLCSWVEEFARPLEPANYNGPGQVVVSGSMAACNWLSKNLNSQNFKDTFPDFPKIKLIPLKVSAPFHCSMMRPAESEMRNVLKTIDFNDPKWVVVQNFSAQFYSDPDLIRDDLIKQVTGAVRWTACVKKLIRLGCTNYIEFGSGKVLSRLANKIDSSGINTFNMTSLDELILLEQKLKDQRSFVAGSPDLAQRN